MGNGALVLWGCGTALWAMGLRLRPGDWPSVPTKGRPAVPSILVPQLTHCQHPAVKRVGSTPLWQVHNMQLS